MSRATLSCDPISTDCISFQWMYRIKHLHRHHCATVLFWRAVKKVPPSVQRHACNEWILRRCECKCVVACLSLTWRLVQGGLWHRPVFIVITVRSWGSSPRLACLENSFLNGVVLVGSHEKRDWMTSAFAHCELKMAFWELLRYQR